MKYRPLLDWGLGTRLLYVLPCWKESEFWLSLPRWQHDTLHKFILSVATLCLPYLLSRTLVSCVDSILPWIHGPTPLVQVRLCRKNGSNSDTIFGPSSPHFNLRSHASDLKSTTLHNRCNILAPRPNVCHVHRLPSQHWLTSYSQIIWHKYSSRVWTAPPAPRVNI